MDLYKTLSVSAAGMKVQGTRLRVIAENIANSESTAEAPGGEPYRRKTVTFKNTLDRKLGIETVKVGRIGTDPGEFSRHYDPGHPAADAQGYVLTPNVDSLVEISDMREAQRSYEANLRVLQATRSILEETIGILR
jgi:flagellar basal-body rod protein FlgC